MNLQEILEKIGLNHHESKIYMLILEKGSSTASQIAQNTRSPRSTIRSVLDKLCDRGLLSKVFKGKTQIYSCEPVNKLSQFVEKKIENEGKALEELKEAIPLFALLKDNKSASPKVKFFEGEKGIIEAFNHSLYENPEEILFITSFRFFDNPALRKNDLEFYIPTRVKKKIPLRVIAQERPESKEFRKNGPREFRKMRYSPKNFSFQGNMHIYGNFVVFFSGHDREYMAVLIESPVIAATMKTMFEFIWQGCK